MALVLGDAAKARREARRRYERACARLEEKASAVKHFRETDEPAFARWVESEFAKQIDANRRAQAELLDLDALLEQISFYAEVMQCSRREALIAIRSAKKTGTEHALWEAVEQKLHGAAGQARPEDGSDPYTRDCENDEPRRGRNRSERRHQEAEERKGRGAGATDYLKALYRRLVRLLHPDIKGELSPVERQQWQEAQDAYAWHDVQRLEKLVATVEQLDSSEQVLDLDKIPVGDIVDLRQDAERRLSVLGQEIAKYKKEVAWNFSETLKNKRAIAELRRALKTELVYEGAEIQLMLDNLGAILASIEHESTRRGRVPADPLQRSRSDRGGKRRPKGERSPSR